MALGAGTTEHHIGAKMTAGKPKHPLEEGLRLVRQHEAGMKQGLEDPWGAPRHWRRAATRVGGGIGGAAARTWQDGWRGHLAHGGDGERAANIVATIMGRNMYGGDPPP